MELAISLALQLCAYLLLSFTSYNDLLSKICFSAGFAHPCLVWSPRKEFPWHGGMDVGIKYWSLGNVKTSWPYGD